MKNLKTWKQAYLGYNQTIKQCVDTFALDSLILCLSLKLWLVILVCFLLMILKKMIVYFWSILKMNETNSIKATDRTNLTDQKKIKIKWNKQDLNLF